MGQPGNPTMVRKYFEFPEQKFTAHPGEIKIHVYSDRKVSYAASMVSFIIQVINPPKDLFLHPRMFDALVQSPGGCTMACRVRSADSYIVNSFVGSFLAEETIGNYHVVVRMILPREELIKFRNYLELTDGVIRGATTIAVSKNYNADAQKESLRIPCDFKTVSMGMIHGGVEVPKNAVGDFSPESWKQFQPAATREVMFPLTRCKLWGLTCDMRNNNLLYSDRESHEINCVTPYGKSIFKFGRNNSVPVAQHLRRPSGIAFDEVYSRLVVCDKDNHRISFYSLDGQYISSFGGRGHKNGLFEYPWDVAVSSNGTLVVTDSKNKRIQFFDKFGNFLNKYTVFEVNPFEFKSQFDYPRGICFDNTGSNVFVTDFNVNNVIKVPIDVSRHQKILPPGTVLRPQGIVMDYTGNLLVADSRHDCLRHMNSRGEHLSTIRNITNENLAFPINVTMMAGGFVALLRGDGSISIF